MTRAISAARSGQGLAYKTMAATAADELRRRILSGEFPAGFQLRQDALAEAFGVSRVPLREALVQLEAEGLVRIVPHKGAVVSELSLEEIEELFDLRALVEPMLLKRSAPRLAPEDYAALRAILDEYGAELKADHVSRWGELNTRFHMLLYRHAGRPRSTALVATLLQECDRHTRMQLALAGGTERAQAEHARLVALCEAGDVRGAAALLKAHIEHVGKSLVAYLAGRQEAG